MNQDGYTLAETLAALLMIGLAIGGLAAGVRVIGLDQTAAARHVTDGRSLYGAERALSRLFEGQGPFLSSDAAGLRADDRHFSFSCAAASPCSASLGDDGRGESLSVTGPHGADVVRLPGATSARFAYVGSRTLGAAWPPQTQDPETLQSVVILAGASQAPIVTARLWRQQPVSCAFDPISQNCRVVAQ